MKNIPIIVKRKHGPIVRDSYSPRPLQQVLKDIQHAINWWHSFSRSKYIKVFVKINKLIFIECYNTLD